MSNSIELYNDGKAFTLDVPYLLNSQALKKEDEVDLSLVVPAYNEESRLPPMMKETIEVRLFKKISI